MDDLQFYFFQFDNTFKPSLLSRTRKSASMQLALRFNNDWTWHPSARLGLVQFCRMIVNDWRRVFGS
ncbi:hypothetical protein PAESOLCIP111_03752 [Paenibacillus solanacearum]|uniref:Uncharacterized protein n=1 Tax=Paenibacillus solanacearum TaxID=2048548 RepID=A0A916NJL1_9BACL|nr:hypothetical protein PAESOLCIP111_03752 [Paenibacillus solanacearum]